MLHVQRGKNIDPRIQQLEHIFIALRVLAAFNVGVGQFIHQHDVRLAGQNRVHIHLFEDGRLVFQFLARNRLQSRRKFHDRFAPVSFHHADHNFFAAAGPPHALTQHGVGLSHAGSVAQKQLEHRRPLGRVHSFSHSSGVLGIAAILHAGAEIVESDCTRTPELHGVTEKNFRVVFTFRLLLRVSVTLW